MSTTAVKQNLSLTWKPSSKAKPNTEKAAESKTPALPNEDYQSSDKAEATPMWAKLGRVATRVATGVAGAAVGIGMGFGYATMGSLLGGAIAASAPVLLGGATILGLTYALAADDTTSRALAGGLAGATATALIASTVDPSTLLQFGGELASAATTVAVISSGVMGAVRGSRLPDAITKTETFGEFLNVLNGKSEE